MRKYFIIAWSLLALAACSSSKSESDASGTFEAEETIISAEASGVIREFKVEEGQQLKAGQYLGYIDSTQLYLRKKQLEAQIAAVLGRKPNIGLQLSSLRQQLAAAEKEQQRLSRLVKAEAATQKQLDDVNAQVKVLRRQVAAQESNLNISASGLTLEAVPLQEQIKQLNDQLAKCRIINPVKGSVLTKYAEENEVATLGKPLYKIADLSVMELRAYITGSQLSAVKLDQHVKVLVDNGPDAYKTYDGTVIWINDKAEFTPKTIMTKDERANLVYAIKVRVKNDGSLKIGMYGELKF